ncbi:MAG TPA: hypothetical protein V6C97_11700 [Oculatellaceae cyanobacterium]
MPPITKHSSLEDFLCAFDFVSDKDLRHAKRLSTFTGFPISKCFVMLDCVSDGQLRAVLETRALMHEDAIEQRDLARVLAAVQKGWTLQDALIMVGIDVQTTRRTRVGELLSDAGKISEHSVDQALSMSDFCSLPIGEILRGLSLTTERLIDTTLTVQSQIRRGNLERDEAITRLQTVASSDETSSTYHRVATLLKEAEVARSTLDSVTNVPREPASTERKMDEVLAAAFRIDAMTQQNLVNPELSCNVLKRLNLSLDTLEAYINAQMNAVDLTLVDFLRAAEYLTALRLPVEGTLPPLEAEIDALATEAQSTSSANDTVIPNDQNSLCTVLFAAFNQKNHLLRCALILHELMKSRKLPVRQALVLFGLKQLEFAN